MLNKTASAKRKARRFRSGMSVSEQFFWKTVRNDALGCRFRRQVAIGPYVLDFYVPAAKLCVEIDGVYHLQRQQRDAERDAYLSGLGIMTLRIPASDIFSVEVDLYSPWIREVARLCSERMQQEE